MHLQESVSEPLQNASHSGSAKRGRTHSSREIISLCSRWMSLVARKVCTRCAGACLTYDDPLW